MCLTILISTPVSIECDPSKVAKWIPEANDGFDMLIMITSWMLPVFVIKQVHLIGSEDVVRVGRAAGLPESQLLSTMGHEDIVCGATAIVRGIPSTHGRVYFNRVPLQGQIPDDFKWPSYFWQFRHGQVLNWWVQMKGLRVLHVDSAEFFEHEWTGLEVDLLCLCAIKQVETRLCCRCSSNREPKMVMACHWDSSSHH